MKRIPTVVALLFLINSCTFNAPLNPKLDLSVTDQIPLTIGVYYSTEFLDHEQSETLLGGSKMQFALGRATSPIFDKVFAKLFKEVRKINQRPPLEMRETVDAVIEPRIENFRSTDPIYPLAGTWYAEVRYLFILYTVKGEPFATWSVGGTGRNTSSFTLTPGGASLAAEAANHAIEGAAVNLISEFKQVPAIRSWLVNQGIQ